MAADWAGLLAAVQQVHAAQPHPSQLRGRPQEIVKDELPSPGVLGRHHSFALHCAGCKLRLPPSRPALQKGKLQVHRPRRGSGRVQPQLLAASARKAGEVHESVQGLLQSRRVHPQAAREEKRGEAEAEGPEGRPRRNQGAGTGAGAGEQRIRTRNQRRTLEEGELSQLIGCQTSREAARAQKRVVA